VTVTLLAMFESCHNSGDSEGRCADVAEKLAQLFGWRQTYKVEKLQRSLADSVARRNQLQQQQQLLQSQHVAETVRNREVSDSNKLFPKRVAQNERTNYYNYNIVARMGDRRGANRLDVTFCILYISSNSCSTCFGQPFAHHQELTTA